jgi:hypothetical protein
MVPDERLKQSLELCGNANSHGLEEQENPVE